MHVSVKDSLKKLQTDYIDILYVHHWPYDTDIEELMQQLNHLVASGKVLFLGASDWPAWVVTKANPIRERSRHASIGRLPRTLECHGAIVRKRDPAHVSSRGYGFGTVGRHGLR